MIGLHNLTLDELQNEIEHQDNELAKAVFDRAIPDAEEQGRQVGINEVLEHIYPVSDLLEKVHDIIDGLAETLSGAEMDQLLAIKSLVESVEDHINAAEVIG